MDCYYDAPPDFTPDETVTFEVEIDTPQFDAELVGVSKHEAHFYGTDSVLLPYPLGARVGVREAWFNYFTDNSGKTYFRDTAPHIPYSSFDEPETMPDDAIRHWYIVTEVDVVYDGQWVEKVTMRRDG